jgi:pyruvate formate lyase activating enzyme
MIAAGLQKTSLIDYPGKVSCVIFLSGCNFSCPYCHNPDLARGRYPEEITQDALLAFVAQRSQWLDAVVISGGEPTLHAQLPTLCRSIKNLKLAVKLDTNGSRPEILAELIAGGLVDFLAMDIKTAPQAYGPPLSPIHYSAQVLQSIELILNEAPDYEFRTTCVRPFVDAGAVTAIARAIQGARRYVLQTYRPAELLDPAFALSALPLPPSEMAALQALAAPFVQSCTVR